MHDVLFTDNDPKVCAWLEALIGAGELHGDVLCQDIRTITPEQVNGRRQVHFFAGIGGWALALRYAGWPDDRPVWTGSCPCQPFSSAGRQRAHQDDRHLWPTWNRIIQACKPPTIFGEQVASSEVVGTQQEAAFTLAVQRGDYAKANKLAHQLARSKSLHAHLRWVDGVRADLEATGYAFGHSVLGAHSVGAPHIRQRLWWVADAAGDPTRQCGIAGGKAGAGREYRHHDDGCGDGSSGWMGNAQRPRPQRHAGHGDDSDQSRRLAEIAHGSTAEAGGWDVYDWIGCADGKARRIEPGLAPLADGLSESLVRCDGIVQGATCEVKKYAEATKTDTGEVVRMVREAISAPPHERDSQSLGGPVGVCPPEVLLSFVQCVMSTCEASSNKGCITKAGGTEHRDALQLVRLHGEPVCAPHQRGPGRQLGHQSSNALHTLSLILARHASAYWQAASGAYASTGRTTRLRGYGNAIVPQVAARFVRSFMEANQPNPATCGKE